MGLHSLLISVCPNTVWAYQEKDSFRILTARKHFTCYITYYLSLKGRKFLSQTRIKKKMFYIIMWSHTFKKKVSQSCLNIPEDILITLRVFC